MMIFEAPGPPQSWVSAGVRNPEGWLQIWTDCSPKFPQMMRA